MLLRVSGAGLSVSDFVGDSSVSSSPGSDILTFAVTGPDPGLTERLANAYACAYSAYRQQLDTDSIERALADVQQRLRRLDRVGATLKRKGSPSARSQIRVALHKPHRSPADARVDAGAPDPRCIGARQAEGSVLTQPKTLRNVAARPSSSGSCSASRLCSCREALETRVRTAEEISARLGGLPLLGRVPSPPKRLRRAGRLVMIEEPASLRAEAFRMLRANLDFVTLDRDVRTIMVTSALQQEGRSTTIANLAMAFARAGKRVALVDLRSAPPGARARLRRDRAGADRRRARFVPLEEALTQIVLTDPPALGAASPGVAAVTGNGDRTGELRVSSRCYRRARSRPTQASSSLRLRSG